MTLAIRPAPPTVHLQIGGASPHEDLAPALLAELASSCEACPLVEDLAGRLGLDVEDAWGALLRAEADGWVDLWPDDPRGPSATLSPLSAGRLGLELSPDGSRWVRIGSKRHAQRRSPGKTVAETDRDFEESPPLDEMPDDRVSRPDQEAEVREEIERAPARWAGDYLSRPLQFPTRFLGSTSTWPLPGQRNDDGTRRPAIARVGERQAPPRTPRSAGPCAGCGGGPLTAAEYCLACGRGGQDHLIPKPRPIRDPKPAGTQKGGKGATGKRQSPGKVAAKFTPKVRPTPPRVRSRAS